MVLFLYYLFYRKEKSLWMKKPQHRHLANAEIGVDTEHLGDIIQSAYMQTVFDVTKGADYRAAFDLIPESRVKAILSTNWSGQMFSQRVWDNTNALADGLKHDMLVGIMAEKSEQHMADDIMSCCGVGAFEARRLVRTETTCVANMAELYGYKELDIDEYEFSACLDSRTSDLCRELDGKVFKRNSAQAGVNLPPMHPFCRSTTLPVLPSEEDLDKELAELGDEIGADVDFDEWERNLQQGEDGKWRYVAGSAGKRFAELGYDTVLISQYGGCSETCEPYQGKVYIDDVFTIWNGERSGDFGKSNYCDKWFMLLSVAIRGGLFHPNCRHTMGQYIEGLTKIPQPIPAEKIREQRELEEKQRAMERKIRALKRKVEGTQDEKKVKEYKRKLREEQGKLREFIKEHDDVLRRDYSREKIYSGKGEPKQAAPRTEEAPVKATDTESKNPVPTDKEPNIPQSDNNVSEPENNVSKPDNNENTMNFVQPESVKPVEATADSEEDVQNFTDDTVDNSDESDIIDIERSMAAKSFDKATKYARKELKISISSLSELPLETVNAINSSMHRLYQEIPVLKGSVSEVVLEDMAEIAKASVSWLDGTTPRIRIKINSLLFQSGSIGEIEQHIAQIAINHEITPKDGIYGLLLHESVHIREYLITAKKCSSLAEFKLSLDSFEEAKSIMNTALANCGLLSDTRVCERFLSEYATENPAEFIAEAFSSTENNDLVLEVKRLLKKKWGM